MDLLREAIGPERSNCFSRVVHTRCLRKSFVIPDPPDPYGSGHANTSFIRPKRNGKNHKRGILVNAYFQNTY